MSSLFCFYDKVSSAQIEASEFRCIHTCDVVAHAALTLMDVVIAPSSNALPPTFHSIVPSNDPM